MQQSSTPHSKLPFAQFFKTVKNAVTIVKSHIAFSLLHTSAGWQAALQSSALNFGD